MITVENLAEAVELAKQGKQSMCKCPAHDDGQASLHVSPGSSQPVVMMCHARCSTDDILAAGGLDFQALLGERQEDTTSVGNRKEWTPAGDASHVYDYVDEEGTLLYQVLRIPTAGGGKTFRQRQPDGTAKSGWKWSMDGARRVLYHLPEVLSAKLSGDVIYIVEGEKDVETLRRNGETATTSPMGAGKWTEAYTQSLAGATVCIIPDADATGRAHARAVREALVEAGCTVSMKETMTGTKDITEHFGKGGDIASLMETVPEGEQTREVYGVDILEVITRTVKPESYVIPNVLAKGDRLLLTAFEGHGKALALDTKVATPSGMVELEKLQVGDLVYAGNGNITEVTAKSEVFTDKDCYEVEFDDGTTVIAAGDHLWETETRASREASARARRRPELLQPRGTDQRFKRVHEPKIVTTEHIAATLTTPSGGVNHSVAVCGKLQGHNEPLPVDPYTLGAWLGDGHSAGARITIHPDDEAIIDRIRAAGWAVTKTSGQYLWSITGEKRWNGSLSAILRGLGLLGDKHIPAVYLHAAPEARLALVQGLMDTDGTVSTEGQSEFCTTSVALAEGMSWLLRSLGIKVRHAEGRSTLNGVDCGPKYRLIFTTDEPVFHLPRKAARITPRQTARQRLRYITAVRPVPRVPVQCIQVADECHTYLVTHSLIPTHNSTLMRQLAIMVAAGIHPWDKSPIPAKKVVVVDSENHPDQVLGSWQQLIGLARANGYDIAPGMLTIIEAWDADLDLTTPEGHAWLMERVHAHQPELMCIGPLYNLTAGDLKDPGPATLMKKAVNDARGICGTAFIMEHHAPHRSATDAKRSVRPYGHTVLLRWPDFGYGLNPQDQEGIYEWQPTRMPRVRSRYFPTHLRWGKKETREFPWETAHEDAEGNFY